MGVGVGVWVCGCVGEREREREREREGERYMGSETLQCDRMARLIAQRLAIINTCKIRQIAYFCQNWLRI